MHFPIDKKSIIKKAAAAMALCLVLAPSALSADGSAAEDAETLYHFGLFQGKGAGPDGAPDFALSEGATRAEAAVMLTRLMGKEAEAQARFLEGSTACPFTDVPDWAKPCVAWLHVGGYVNGFSDTEFGAGRHISAQQFATMLLRCLDYSDQSGGQFSYGDAVTFAVSVGLVDESRTADYAASFLRGGMAEMCRNALYLNRRGTDRSLLDSLRAEGVIREPGAAAHSAPLQLTELYTGGGSLGPWVMEEPLETEAVVTDLDGDGSKELLMMIRSLYCLDAATGAIRWTTPTGRSVSEQADASAYFGAATLPAPIRVADVDGDGASEVVAFATNYALDKTLICIYDGSGELLRSWETPVVARAAEVADLDGDGSCEIAVGLGVDSRYTSIDALYVYNSDGSVRPGWPQPRGYGLYSDTLRAVDLDHDGVKELMAIYDGDEVAAYHADGRPVRVQSGPYAGLNWDAISVWEDMDQELSTLDLARGSSLNNAAWASSGGVTNPSRGRAGKNCIAGTYGGILQTDVDGDGTQELVFTSMIVDIDRVGELMTQNVDTYEGSAQYFTAFLLREDRSRYTNPAKGFDWTQFPRDTGNYLTLAEDYGPGQRVSKPNLAPVAADLDGDGNKEILFSSYDGRVHCFSLDGTEHDGWPFAVDQTVLSFATKPAVADLDGDGRQEVVFATYTDSTQTAVRGRLYVLDCEGNVRAELTLPSMWGLNGAQDSLYPNGSKATPVLEDVTGDGRQEILVNTLNSGVCVYSIG